MNSNGIFAVRCYMSSSHKRHTSRRMPDNPSDILSRHAILPWQRQQWHYNNFRRAIHSIVLHVGPFVFRRHILLSVRRQCQRRESGPTRNKSDIILVFRNSYECRCSIRMKWTESRMPLSTCIVRYTFPFRLYDHVTWYINAHSLRTRKYLRCVFCVNLEWQQWDERVSVRCIMRYESLLFLLLLNSRDRYMVWGIWRVKPVGSLLNRIKKKLF